MSIFFHYENSFKLKKARSIKKWLLQVAEENQRSVATINYIFCDDAYLHEINLTYLQHDDYTDIITFDYSENPLPILSDIYISVERVAENAAERNIKFEDELLRVMVHGLLHIIGLKDKTEKEALQMRQAEDAALRLLQLD